MKADSIAIFHSNDHMPRNGDQGYRFRQNSDLFYLSGLDQAECVLVLYPGSPRDGYQEMVFIKRISEHDAMWQGSMYTPETAREISGVEKVHYLDEMEVVLRPLILAAKRIYLNTNENSRYFSDVPYRDFRMGRELMAQYPLHKYHRAQPILRKLRMIKSPYEQGVMQRAIDITARAFERVVRFVEPGVGEYEVEAEIIHELLRNRATGFAYDSVIASGADNCILHYDANNKVCREGELLLLDFGAEYAHYAADLSRTIPVSGRFTDRQRQVYDAVLRVQRAAIQLFVPGNTLEEYHQQVGELLTAELLDLSLLDRTDVKNQTKEQPAHKRYSYHRTAHHLGLDVHDLHNPYTFMQAGMVFTCEPGIYLPDEGFGIRLENNILITDDGPQDLTGHIPIEAEEIEEMMASRQLVEEVE